MKILQIGKYYYPQVGGIETHLHQLCNELRNFHEIEVIVSNNTRKSVCDIIDGVSVKRVGSMLEFSSTQICPTMWKYIKMWEGDLIHIHLPNPMSVASLLLNKPSAKIVVSYHSDVVRQKILYKVYSPLMMDLLEKASCVIATSPNYIESSPVLQNFKNKCKVVSYGIDFSKYSAGSVNFKKVNEIRDAYGPRIVLFVGRLVYYKGVSYLIDAMGKVDAKLLIIGDGPLWGRLKKRTTKKQLNDKVFFMGSMFNADTIPYFHACDVFTLPSIARSEAFGIVQLEAMACGKPVVSTNLPTGVPYVNLHEKTGIIVPYRDSSALANAINMLFANENMRYQLGSYAKHRVKTNFTKEITVSKIMGIYNSVCDKP